MGKEIKSGIYIVINPAQNNDDILNQLVQIKDESIAAIQIWDNPDVKALNENLIDEIIQLFKNSTPILINNQWELLKEFEFDGVHFDKIPGNYNELINEINRDFIKGITLGNDLNIVEKADNLNFDYVSFCSMFPSQTSDNCEIVRTETVLKCREITDMPIFLAGGITPNNIKELKNLSFQGVAVVSGIMNAHQPKEALKKYKLQFKKMKLCS